MKKEVFFLSMLLISCSVFYSCEKENENLRSKSIPEVVTQSALSQTAVNAALTWLNNQKSASRFKSAEKIKLLINNLDVSGAKTESFSPAEQFIMIPVKSEYNRANNIDARNMLYLAVYATTNGEIKGGRLLEFVPEASINLNAIQVGFTKVFKAEFPGVNGRFKVSRLDGKLINQVAFKEGKLFSYGIVKKKSDENNSARMDPPEGCTDWYLYETWYDENGNLIDYTLTYLFTECEEEDGGGGGGWPGDECNMTFEEAEAALAAISSTIISNGTSDSGPESGPDANGIIERPVVVKRHGINYRFPGGRTALYKLIFPGILFKTTTNSQWKWKELRFSHIDLWEGDPGPCYYVDFTPAVSLTIDADKLKARFVAAITAKLKSACADGLILRSKGESLDGVYPASDF